MTLIKSISGIRGTIGGKTGDTLNPLDIVKFTTAYATFIRRNAQNPTNKIVVGRDARISGEMVRSIVCGSLIGMGFDVVDIGLASTPTTELAVIMEKADGGIIITASHNPRQWNALKMLNEQGEFLNATEAAEVVALAEECNFEYADVDHLGKYTEDFSFGQKHIDFIKELKLVDIDAIRKANFSVAIDTVNSVGGVILPELLKQLGVSKIKGLFLEPTGDFQHNPEPLEVNLSVMKSEMQKGIYDIGFVVDPDVDPVDPVDPVVDPEEPVVDPVDPVVDPEEPVVDPKDPEEEISTGVIELAKNDVDSKSINGRNGIIHFSGFKAGSKVEVFNISGKAVESHIIPQDGTLDINISSYPSGNYIFKANTLTYKINKK